MTKEKLEKEAEEYLKKKNYTSGYIGYFASGYCKQAYIDCAEPREKRIEELEEKLEQTEKDLADYQFNYLTIKELKKKNAELEKDKAYTEGQLDEQIQATLKLQKENAELKEKSSRQSKNYKCDVDKLLEENAELKARVENQKSFLERIRVKFELGEIDRKEIEGYLESEQLTKAKDFLGELFKR